MNYTGPISCGGHVTRDEGMCLLELVAYLAGEDHTETPACCCPVLARYGRALNDGMGAGPAGDALRDRHLRDLARMLIGTRDQQHEAARERILYRAAKEIFLPLAAPEQHAHVRHAVEDSCAPGLSDRAADAAALVGCWDEARDALIRAIRLES